MSYQSPDEPPWREPPEARFNVPRWEPDYLSVPTWARLPSWAVVFVLSQLSQGSEELPALVMLVALPAFAVVLADVWVFVRRWYLSWLYVRNEF